MKKLLLSIVALCAVALASAQEVVTLTVNGQGTTKDVAVASALRSAIEQSFGVFVSANTTILNDELVKDEIATVASGNIQQYKEVSCVNMPNGEVSVTLSATVAINKLVAYAQSKGSTAEFAGQTFLLNMKMLELNKQNEIKALQHAQQQLQALAEHMFDWNLSMGNPFDAGDTFAIDMMVTAVSNEASNAFYETFFGVLNSLSLSKEQIKEYRDANMKTYAVRVQSYDREKGLDPWGNSNSYKEVFTFRSEYIFDFIEDIQYVLRATSLSFKIREVNDITRTYSKPCDKYPPVDQRKDSRELYALLEDAYTLYHLISGGYHIGTPANPEYITYDRGIDITGLTKYTIKIVKKRKSPEPIIHTNDVLSHKMRIKISKDRIGSIAGFEVVRDQKYRKDVEINY